MLGAVFGFMAAVSSANTLPPTPIFQSYRRHAEPLVEQAVRVSALSFCGFVDGQGATEELRDLNIRQVQFTRGMNAGERRTAMYWYAREVDRRFKAVFAPDGDRVKPCRRLAAHR